MKVFLSWSGETSHAVAMALRDWLPSVIQCVEPYVSSKDIEKGARWSSDIAVQLDTSSYGVICLTNSNLDAPWINFEAGALGKSVQRSRVSPLCFRIKKTDVQGPLVQFQLTEADRQDMFALVESINTACGDEGLEPERLDKSFNRCWPELEEALDAIPPEAGTKDSKRAKSPATEVTPLIEELLALTRENTKLLKRRTMAQAFASDPVTVQIKDRYLSSILQELQSLWNLVTKNEESLSSIPVGQALIRRIEALAKIEMRAFDAASDWTFNKHIKFTSDPTTFSRYKVPDDEN
ncbi:TPA: TIR domain-containing protein [Pseudomonas aeruginosa]|nr:TIR domain-containing protein [Pseudomonas aeruginosa]